MALLDSGASHAYRAPKSEEEIRSARRVKVQLADGKTVHLRQNRGGTLLSEDDQGGVILPLGSLVSSLGCELKWSRKRGLQVKHPTHYCPRSSWGTRRSCGRRTLSNSSRTSSRQS